MGQGPNYKASVGDPFESYIAKNVVGVGDALPANSNTFDQFNRISGLATSDKSLNTGAASYQSPSQVTSTLNGYINQVANYDASGNFAYVDPAAIQSKSIHLSVPASTTPTQWTAIQRAVQTAAGKGIQMSVTVVK